MAVKEEGVGESPSSVAVAQIRTDACHLRGVAIAKPAFPIELREFCRGAADFCQPICVTAVSRPEVGHLVVVEAGGVGAEVSNLKSHEL